MNIDELRALVIDGDRGALCDALASLDEKQRQSLADDALKLYESVDKYDFDAAKTDPETIADPADAHLVTEMKKREYEDWRIPRYAAGLAVLGLCDRKVFEGSRGSWFFGDLRSMPHRVLQILDARRPQWLAAWIAKDAVKEYAVTSWFVERGLIRSGAIPANDSDLYLERMAGDVGDYANFSPLLEIYGESKLDKTAYADSIEQLLLDDPDLLADEIWRFFEVETNAFVYDWQWRETLIEMSIKRIIDRDRLLLSCLEAMSRPFRKQTLSAFVKLHDQIEPTLDELEKLIDEYITLLSNELPQVVGCGLKTCELLAKAKHLDVGVFFEACPPIFQLANKAQPRKAIKLAKSLVRADTSVAESAVKAVAHGMGNEAPDVQEETLDFLEPLKGSISEETKAALRDWTDHVAASLRPRFDELVADVAAQPEATGAAASNPAAPASAGAQDFEDRLAGIATELREATGVQQALRWLQDESDPHATELDPKRVPRRDPSATVQPLGSLDELIDAVAALIEGVDDVMDVERVIDGIARFHLEKPKDFAKRVGPLRKRVEARSEPYSFTVLDRGAEVGLSQLIRLWLGMPEVHRDWGSWRDLDGAIFRLRTQELRWRMDGPVADRTSQPILALPTHADGWIDPLAFVERLAGYALNYGDYLTDNYDLAQALLRLTPDGRQEALQALSKDRRGSTARLVRYALGDDVELVNPGGYGGEDVMLAAFHCRSLIDEQASATSFAQPVARLSEAGDVVLQGPLANDPAMPGSLLSKTHSLLEPPESWGGSPGGADWLADWQNLTWPANRGPLCLYASLSSAPTCYLKNLLERDTNWGEEACRLAAWALGAAQPIAKGLITDALIDGMGSNLVDPRRLGRNLARILPHLKLNRVASVLNETSRISPLHHWHVFKTLESTLGALDETPRDLHHLLTTLVESATVTGKTLDEPASKFLKAIKGSSKTAKLAKQALALKHAPERMLAVREAVLVAAIERAERWNSLAG